MKTLSKTSGVIAIICLLLTIIGISVYYILEFVSLSDIFQINLVEIGSIFWPVIYVCFCISACSFALSYVIDKRYR